MKKVVKSCAAARDIQTAAEYYRDEADLQVAESFINAVQQAVQQIARWPGSGSGRFAEVLGLPGLRTVALRRFPYIIFYIERHDQVDVWRVLHAHRDIPDALRDGFDLPSGFK